ncbi:MAG TPA: universal stress protein [Burkholderiaceae bacterium]|nr:universal stress protein [Burkholderiaceae bacterium]
MSYKTILVHVDESRHVDARIEIAAKIALAENAHLIGAAMTGVPEVIYQTIAFSPAVSIAPFLETLRQHADNALQKFSDIASRIGVSSVEKRLIDDEAADGLSAQARYCDLMVLGQNDPDERSLTVTPNFPEQVIIGSGCPALIIPYTGALKSIGTKVLVAWNGSMEARRAVHDAIPLLQRADLVEVVVFNPAADMQEEQPGADIALYLTRHGIKIDVKEEITSDSDIGNALLSRAADLGSDMLVMGCYGHSRLREIVLGGASRTILESMTLPVLMSH